MTENEKELVKKYPEAAAFAGVASSVWNGSISPAKVEMTVKGKLYAELKKLLNKTGAADTHRPGIQTVRVVLFRNRSQACRESAA